MGRQTALFFLTVGAVAGLCYYCFVLNPHLKSLVTPTKPNKKKSTKTRSRGKKKKVTRVKDESMPMEAKASLLTHDNDTGAVSSDEEEDEDRDLIINCSFDSENAQFLESLTFRPIQAYEAYKVDELIDSTFLRSNPKLCTDLKALKKKLEAKHSFIHSHVITLDNKVIAYAATTEVEIRSTARKIQQTNKVLYTSLANLHELPTHNRHFKDSVTKMKVISELDDDKEKEKEKNKDKEKDVTSDAKEVKEYAQKLRGLAIGPIVVHPMYRRKRVGTLLMRRILMQIKHSWEFVSTYSYVCAASPKEMAPFFEKFDLNDAEEYQLRCDLNSTYTKDQVFRILITDKCKVLQFLATMVGNKAANALVPKKEAILVHYLPEFQDM